MSFAFFVFWVFLFADFLFSAPRLTRLVAAVGLSVSIGTSFLLTGVFSVLFGVLVILRLERRMGVSSVVVGRLDPLSAFGEVVTISSYWFRRSRGFCVFELWYWAYGVLKIIVLVPRTVCGIFVR